ncbi:hypothetical protein UlMin_027454 [Ulmus minor]
MARAALQICIFLFLLYGVCGLNLPGGVAPEDFQKRDLLKIKVNKLTSTKTHLPYSFYSLPYCPPKQHTVDDENSPYEFRMREPTKCNVLCRIILDAKTAKDLKEKIDDEYRVNMVLDSLSLVVPVRRLDGSPSIVYQHGFPVGFIGNYAWTKDEVHSISNHLAFTIKFREDQTTGLLRIVGFEVIPSSIEHKYEGEWSDKLTRLTTCDPHARARRSIYQFQLPQRVEDGKEIIFTYDVDFQESDVKWESRWDVYLLNISDETMWFSIVNSLLIVLLLSGKVAMIMWSTLYREISKYNQLEMTQEEAGWKLLKGDAFRPTISNSDLLCVFVGTGVELFGMVLVTLIFAALGFLSHSNRKGGLELITMLFFWVFMGIFGGYSSARLYKMFNGTEWKKIALKTAFMFPATLFAIFFALNALISGEKSSGAVPTGTMFALLLLWFGISVPLVFIGSYIGFKKETNNRQDQDQDPVEISKVGRKIPKQSWYMNPAFAILIGGILPFGVVFNQLFFVLTSIWLHQFYNNVFRFLFIIFPILILTCAEITIMFCYFQLRHGDYIWWWRSYLTSGSSGLYLFLYSAFYFFTKLEIEKTVSVALYFGSMLIASFAFFMVTGTIGFYACFWFTRLIYSSIKIK